MAGLELFDFESVGIWSDGDAQKRFQTYYNYLANLENFLKKQDLKKGLELIVMDRKFKSIKPKNVDMGMIKKCLSLAWATELCLDQTAEQPAILIASICWTPIQSYYMNFHLLRALLFCMDVKTNSHEATLKAIAETIKLRPTIFPTPWNVLCIDDPERLEFLNIPEKPKKVSNLKEPSPETFWDNYALFLKTTRERQLEIKYVKRRKELNKKHLNKTEKQTLLHKQTPTSIFDALYRIRLRCNYQDIEIFLETPKTLREENFSKFTGTLLLISKQTARILELLIARYLGKKQYECLILEINKSMKEQGNQTFIERWNKNKTLW